MVPEDDIGRRHKVELQPATGVHQEIETPVSDIANSDLVVAVTPHTLAQVGAAGAAGTSIPTSTLLGSRPARGLSTTGAWIRKASPRHARKTGAACAKPAQLAQRALRDSPK